ncbi:tRNA lysidine(34) synthetase TilS [Moraxella oblonga]|uniref:tRNA lysidine(34) synthetase TilS n=1 Tax=Moraxella oblonga TaxID=200413 RepID=UPI0008301DAC|nr:tRNA lysidine(34) synthetase TilS [Moraxella oblonga]
MSCPILDVLGGLADIDKAVFVGCSGGRDSMSLAFGCYLLYQSGVLKKLPTLIHINHGIQNANDEWADFVKTWANERGFVCHVVCLYLGQSNETHARDARYHAIANLMQEGDVLLTAHHADDQAETVLMRLINGAGVQGLSGIKAWQNRTISGKNLTIHRPFLAISRQDITDFAHRHGLAYVDDPTNDTTDNARSFIRNDILPSLATLNPKVKDNIAKVATFMGEASELLHQMMSEKFEQVLIATPHTLVVSMLDVAKLVTLSKPMQSAVVRHWVQGDEVLPPNAQITKDVVALAHRTDNDHRVQIFWQVSGAGHAFVICRYKHILYRYRQELFLLLNTHVDDTPIVPQTKQTILKQNEQFLLVWRYPQSLEFLFIHKTVCIQPIGKTSVRVVVMYQNKNGQHRQGFDVLSNKKLYQTLNIPTWQRQNLWGLYVNDELVMMMGVDGWWLTDSTMLGALMAMSDEFGDTFVSVCQRDEYFAQTASLM